jgi:hypothetical protein
MVSPSTLRQARDTFPVALARLIACSAKAGTSPIWVVEGDQDLKYYGSRIELIAQSDYEHFVVAGGKSVVTRLLEHTKATAELRNLRVAFLVDRDFDGKHKKDRRLYVTPVYSIENFYVGDKVIRKILRAEFGSRDEELTRVCKIYKRWLRKFGKASLDLNAWIHAQRAKERSGGGGRLNLRGVTFGFLFQLKFTKDAINVVQRVATKDLDTVFPLASKLTPSELEVSRKAMKKVDLARAGRGKYLFAFLREALMHLKRDCVSVNPYLFDKKGKVSLAISGNLLSELSQYAHTPACLRKFLAAYA